MSVSLPLDDGFLRRECPACERQFKWHAGPTEERPTDAEEPAVYWCPYCGETAVADHWWTQDQLDYATASAAGPLLRGIADDFNREMGNGGRNSLFQISMTHDEPEPPPALHEPADMVVVLPPCHPWEPIKVAEDWHDPIHCLLCGAAFALA